MQLLNEALLRVLTGWHGLQARAQDEEGQTLAEYGLIMAFIAVAVVVGSVVLFRTAIVTPSTAPRTVWTEAAKRGDRRTTRGAPDWGPSGFKPTGSCSQGKA